MNINMKIKDKSAKWIVLSFIFLSFHLLAHDPEPKQVLNPLFSGLDSAAAKVVQNFHRALASGDEAAVKVMLDSTVTVFEGNGIERSLAEYANHHLKADIEFLKQVKSTLLEHNVEELGQTAISKSRSELIGIYQNKPIASTSIETILLKKYHDTWKIVHIHWSH